MRSPTLASFLFALLAGPTFAQASIEDGAFPPPGTWTTAGGSASQAGAALGDPLRGPVEIAWRFPNAGALKGTIEGEPLVWENRALVSVRETDAKRNFHVIDLQDGKPVKTLAFQTQAPLAPVISNGVLVLRSAPNKLEAWRVRSAELEKISWQHQTAAPLSAPRMIGREIYVRASGSILRLALGRTGAVWERSGNYCGDPSVRGNHVYCVAYPKAGKPMLAWLRRSDGHEESAVESGEHANEQRPSADAEARVTVLGPTVFLHHAWPVLTNEGPVNTTGFKRTVDAAGRVKLELFALYNLAKDGGVVPFGAGFAATLEEPDGLKLISTDGDPDKYYILASKAQLAEFAAPRAPASCGGVCFLGAGAVDEATKRVLWRAPSPTRSRMVPTRGCVLFVDGEGRLSAVRAKRTERAAPRFVAGADSRAASRPTSPATPSPAPFALGQARAVLQDATVVEGKLILDAARGQLVREGSPKPQSFALDDVLLVEDASGKMAYAGPDDAAMRALGILSERGIGEAYVALAIDSDKAQDPRLTERLIGEAWTRGAPPKEIARAQAKLEERLKKPGAPKADEAKRIAEVESALLAGTSKPAWDRFLALPPDAPWDLRSELLTAVLARDPTHREAIEAVRREIPPGLTVGEPFEASDWLDFVDATKHLKIEIVAPPGDAPNPSDAQRLLGSSIATWRPDLVGIKSDNLLIVTPVRQPGRIARCLSGGELVCQTLEKLFAGGTVKRDKRHPIQLLLYETKAEYEEQCKRSPFGTSSHISWTAGNYHSLEQMARMYLPPGKDGFQKVFAVYAHEMTHAWIEERCPLFGSAARGISTARDVAGHWVVEGFATMIENLDFELRARTWRVRPQPNPLDIVANAKAGDLLPWKSLYAADAQDFQQLDPNPKIEIPSGLMLGAGHRLSASRMFYDQAGTTCLYLLEAEGAKYRDRLMKYVGDHYGSRADQLDIQTAFGMSADELGARVLQYARTATGSGAK